VAFTTAVFVIPTKCRFAENQRRFVGIDSDGEGARTAGVDSVDAESARRVPAVVSLARGVPALMPLTGPLSD